MNTKPSRPLYVPVIILTIAFGLTGAGCSKKKDAKLTAQAPPPVVVVEQISEKTVPIYSEYVGQTRAEETVELRARVEGVLNKVYFREGMPVRKGQLLFTIEKRPFQAAVQSAKAILAKSIADLAQAKQRADVLQAQAELADAQAVHSKTQQDLARLTPLAKEKAVTELELDAAVAAEKSAQANVNCCHSSVTSISTNGRTHGPASGQEPPSITMTASSMVRLTLTLPAGDVPRAQNVMPV